MARRKWLIPREHGGWMMLYAPLVVGVAHGGVLRADLLALLILATGGYGFRVPLGVLFSRRAGEHALARKWLVGYGAAILLGVAGLWRHPNRERLLLVALLGVALFFVHFALTVRREHRGVFGELLGVAGLTLTAPLGALAALGDNGARAIVLWVVNFLFFSSSVFYVKWRVRSQVAEKRGARASGELASLIVYHVVAAIVLGVLIWREWVPGWILVAFAPLGLRFLLPVFVGGTPTLPQTGVTEIVLSLLYVGVMVLLR